ncbi:MAG: phosphate ABC transporter substrate-binding protein [Acidobacteria bacterium]|nr:phosphate ABC transporter substrate-binding protein [Acidobacteriota bacterium]
MKKLLVMASISMITALFNGCGANEPVKTASAPTPAPSNQMVIVGSTTLLPVAQKGVDAFKKRKQDPKIIINIQGGGSQIGINALVDGLSDIAMSSRELKDEEKEKLRAKKMEAKGHIVAWDGIVPIVHPSNPVKNLTIAQLKDIYTGKVTDWGNVGGKKGSIIVLSRDTTSGTYEVWSERVLNQEPVVAAAQLWGTSEAVLENVASEPNAIGYEGIDYVEGNSRVKSVSVDGVKASAVAVSDRSYKIARPIYMFTRSNPNALVVEFLEFILSAEGQALVKEAKFAPVQQK